MADDGSLRRFSADDSFRMPDLESVLPRHGRVVALAPEVLRFSYFDTEDLRLTRAGQALWFQRFTEPRFERDRHADTDAMPWRLAIHGETLGFAGTSATVPEPVAAAVTAYTRGSALGSVAVLRISRVVYQLRDRKGRELGRVIDDRISVLDARRIKDKFRQIRVDVGRGDAAFARAVVRMLRRAGASESGYRLPQLRALGEPAQAPADIPEPVPTRAGAGVSDILTNVLRRDLLRLVDSDVAVRLRGDDGVHRMRVAARRLRSDITTFRPLLDSAWVDRIRTDLAWVGAALGAARDAEVLRLRLRQTADLDPVAPLDQAALARIDADLTARGEDAGAGLDLVLAAPRYLALLDALVAATSDPPVVAKARPRQLHRLVGHAYHRLVSGGTTTIGAADVGALDSDRAWHRVRKRAKIARYAAEAAADLDPRAAHLAHALADVSDLLGEHQDAVLAAATWLSVATDDPDDHVLAVTAGRLAERDRARARRVRERYPEVWAAVDRGKLTKWLR